MLIDNIRKYNNFLPDFLVFILYGVVGILIPYSMFSIDPTSPMLYIPFIGPITFILLGIITAFYNKNILHTIFASMIAVIPILLYFRFGTKVTIHTWEILYFVLYILSYCIVIKLKKKK